MSDPLLDRLDSRWLLNEHSTRVNEWKEPRNAKIEIRYLFKNREGLFRR